jgi:hypothetical protein
MKSVALFVSALALGAAAIPFNGPDFEKRSAGINNGEVTLLGTREVNGVTVQKAKIRYGPYHVPGAEVLEPSTLQTMWQGRSKGSLTNIPSMNIKKPCSDCMITYFRADLEDTPGKDLNIDEGLMLHHMVLFNGGTGHRDSTCGKRPVSLPHTSINAPPSKTERIFSSGNERSVADFLTIAEGEKYGYKVNSGDRFYLLMDLMNMNKEAKDVYLVMHYEYLPTSEAEGFNNLKPVWLDANDCNTSDVSAPPGKKVFHIESKAWTADFGGELVLGIGHLHDGGQKLTVEINDKVVCTANQKYGTTPRYVEMSAKGKSLATRDRAMPGMKHISESSECTKFASFKSGDRLVTRGFYDA